MATVKTRDFKNTVTSGVKTDIAKFAKFNKGNIKTGKMLTWSKLYGDTPVYSAYLDMTATGSCGGFCAGCSKICYVSKSYRYPSVIVRHLINTVSMRYAIHEVFSKLDADLSRTKFDIIRIHQSGELESELEFLQWCELGKKHPGKIFFLYTKAYDYVEKALKAGRVPLNVIVNISVYHEQGIDVFFRLKHLVNVHAFVIDDGFDYGTFGLYETTRCNAYKDGKLDHNITCDKCKKCFSLYDFAKVIFCAEH